MEKGRGRGLFLKVWFRILFWNKPNQKYTHTHTCIFHTKYIKAQGYYPASEIRVLFIKVMSHLFTWFSEFSKFSQNSFYLTILDGNLGWNSIPIFCFIRQHKWHRSGCSQSLSQFPSSPPPSPLHCDTCTWCGQFLWPCPRSSAMPNLLIFSPTI